MPRPEPARLFTFAPPWSHAPIHLAAFHSGLQRAMVTVSSDEILSGTEWDALALALDGGLMYDAAPDAAWEVLELREVRGLTAISRVMLLGAERTVQRGPWSTAFSCVPLPDDLLLRMRHAPPPFRNALGVTAALRAQLALRGSSCAGKISHPLWHFPVGTPTTEVHRFLHHAQPAIGPDVWNAVGQLYTDMELLPGTPVCVALQTMLNTRSSGPRSAEQVNFLSWTGQKAAETLSELNLTALEETENLIAALSAALQGQNHTDAPALIAALRPHAARLGQGFAWSNDPQRSDSP